MELKLAKIFLSCILHIRGFLRRGLWHRHKFLEENNLYKKASRKDFKNRYIMYRMVLYFYNVSTTAFNSSSFVFEISLFLYFTITFKGLRSLLFGLEMPRKSSKSFFKDINTVCKRSFFALDEFVTYFVNSTIFITVH